MIHVIVETPPTVRSVSSLVASQPLPVFSRKNHISSADLWRARRYRKAFERDDDPPNLLSFAPPHPPRPPPPPKKKREKKRALYLSCIKCFANAGQSAPLWNSGCPKRFFLAFAYRRLSLLKLTVIDCLRESEDHNYLYLYIYIPLYFLHSFSFVAEGLRLLFALRTSCRTWLLNKRRVTSSRHGIKYG